MRYAYRNKKRRSAGGHRFARGFLPNGGHPLFLFGWISHYVRDCWMLSLTPPLFRKCGENRKPLSKTHFLQQNGTGRRCSKKGSGRPVVLDLKWDCHVFKEVIAPAVVEHPLSVHQIYHNSRAVSSILSDTLDFCRGLAVMIR